MGHSKLSENKITLRGVGEGNGQRFQPQWPFLCKIRIRITRLGRTWANMCNSACYASRSSSSIKSGARRVMRLDEISSVVRRPRRTTQDSSTRRIIRLVPLFTPGELQDAEQDELTLFSPKFVPVRL